MGDGFDVPRQAKDIVQRALARTLGPALAAWFGLDIPAVAEILPNDWPTVDVRQRSADTVYRTTDGSIRHVEFQTRATPPLVRYADYAFTLYQIHRVPIRTLVV